MSFPEQKDPPVSEGIARELVPCPSDLQLTEAQRFTLEARCGIPAWGVEACLVDFVLAATADPDQRVALKTWRIWAEQHVRRLWSSPRRPERPAEPVSESEARQQRAARRAALREEARRSEEAFRAMVQKSGPPPPEALAYLRRIGVRIPEMPRG
jgi:hypothetical protein